MKLSELFQTLNNIGEFGNPIDSEKLAVWLDEQQTIQQAEGASALFSKIERGEIVGLSVEK